MGSPDRAASAQGVWVACFSFLKKVGMAGPGALGYSMEVCLGLAHLTRAETPFLSPFPSNFLPQFLPHPLVSKVPSSISPPGPLGAVRWADMGLDSLRHLWVDTEIL